MSEYPEVIDDPRVIDVTNALSEIIDRSAQEIAQLLEVIRVLGARDPCPMCGRAGSDAPHGGDCFIAIALETVAEPTIVTDLRQQLADRDATIAALRGALRPFAEYGAHWMPISDEHYVLLVEHSQVSDIDTTSRVCVGDVAHAFITYNECVVPESEAVQRCEYCAAGKPFAYGRDGFHDIGGDDALFAKCANYKREAVRE